MLLPLRYKIKLSIRLYVLCKIFYFSEPARNLQLTNTLHTDNIIRNELFHFQR